MPAFYQVFKNENLLVIDPAKDVRAAVLATFPLCYVALCIPVDKATKQHALSKRPLKPGQVRDGPCSRGLDNNFSLHH